MIKHKFFDEEKNILKVEVYNSNFNTIISRNVKYIFDGGEFAVSLQDYNWGYFNFIVLQKRNSINSDLNSFKCEVFCTWNEKIISTAQRYYDLWENKLKNITGLGMYTAQLCVGKLAHLNVETKKFYKSKKVFV